VLLLALLAGCSSTEATLGRSTTVLLVTRGEGAEDSEAQRALRARIEERDDVEPTTLTRLASLAAEEQEDTGEAAQLEAQERIAQAEDAFSRFDYSGATTRLNESLELLRPLARRATGRAELARTHLSLAMVLHVHGERDAALEELRTCVHLDPECAPDPARHPPELIELHREVTAGGGEDATLSVTTDPPRARVTLDGRREQTTPATWEGLSAGRHYVTIERDGFLPEVHLVNVASGAPAERSFALTLGSPSTRASAALRALSADGLEAERRWREQASNLTESDVLLMLSLTPEGLALAAYDARGGILGEPFERDDDDGDAAREFLDGVLPPPTVPWYGQWWFWTPVALGVAIAIAIATTVIVGTPDVRIVGGTSVPE